jgi:Alpha/beta hydrolase family
VRACNDRSPPSMLATNSVATSYRAPGAPDGPDLYIAHDTFREVFCADSSAEKASMMRATQRPLSLAALTENATAAGWKTIPSWYLVSNQDNAIPPEAEVFMAERMGATTEHVDGSHSIHRAAIDRRRTHCEGGRRLTTANDRNDHLARRRGLTAPRHLPVCGVVQGSLARTAGVAWTTKATLIGVGLIAVTVGISPSRPGKRLRSTLGVT